MRKLAKQRAQEAAEEKEEGQKNGTSHSPPVTTTKNGSQEPNNGSTTASKPPSRKQSIRSGKNSLKRRGKGRERTVRESSGVSEGSPETEEEEELPEVDVYDVVNMKGWQGRKPTFWDLLPFLMVYVIWCVVDGIWFHIQWQINFNLLGKAYGEKEEEYLTYKTLNLSFSRWNDLEPEERERLVGKKLWTKQGMKEFRREMIQSRRRKKY